jgi:hypothetical protein
MNNAIKIYEMPKYLSPTAISQSYLQPHTFYATRLLPKEIRMQREPTNMAMAVGTMFDILVKEILYKERGIKCAVPFDEVWETKPPVHLFMEAQTAAKTLMAPYLRSRILNTAGFHQVEGVYDQMYTFPDRDGKMVSIPLLGKLDAIVKDMETGMLVPLDWKCSGYSSAKGTSAKQGYRRIWDSTKNAWKPAHKKYYNNMPVTDLDMGWARQFTIYVIMLNEQLGVPFGTPTPVWVHHPIFNGMNKTPKISEYRAIATKEIQEYFWNEAVDLWHELEDGSFLNRLTIQGDEEDEFTLSALASYAYECECFFRPPAKSANDLRMETYQ